MNIYSLNLATIERYSMKYIIDCICLNLYFTCDRSSSSGTRYYTYSMITIRKFDWVLNIIVYYSYFGNSMSDFYPIWVTSINYIIRYKAIRFKNCMLRSYLILKKTIYKYISLELIERCFFGTYII